MTDKPGGPPPASGSGAPQDSGWRSYSAVIIYWVVFIGILGTMVFVNERYPLVVEKHFAEWTAGVFVNIMRVIGMGGSAEGIVVTSPFCRFNIIGECTAYYPLGIYLAAVAAYPTPLSRRIVGLLLGLPLILAINQFRLVSLCYIYRDYRDLFDAIHALVWQSLMIFFTVVIWIFWVSTLPRERS